MKCTLELFEEYENINFYTIRIDESKLTEAEIFLEKFPFGCEYDEDIDIILSWLEKISQNGALERYFRPEGKFGDGVGAIPIDIGNKVRLYCLRLSDKILIIGNGGVKDAASWEESDILRPIVEMLITVSKEIGRRKKSELLQLSGKYISGLMEFDI